MTRFTQGVLRASEPPLSWLSRVPDCRCSANALFPIRGTRTTSSSVSVLFVMKIVSNEGSIVFLL
jgi:hypothetical protein